MNAKEIHSEIQINQLKSSISLYVTRPHLRMPLRQSRFDRDAREKEVWVVYARELLININTPLRQFDFCAITQTCIAQIALTKTLASLILSYRFYHRF